MPGFPKFRDAKKALVAHPVPELKESMLEGKACFDSPPAGSGRQLSTVVGEQKRARLVQILGIHHIDEEDIHSLLAGGIAFRGRKAFQGTVTAILLAID